jgi:hypothetical protein
MYFIDFICYLIDYFSMFELKLNKTLKSIIYEKIIYLFDVDCIHFLIRSKIIYC